MKKTEYNISEEDFKMEYYNIYSLAHGILSSVLRDYPGGLGPDGFEIECIDVITDPYNHDENTKVFEINISYNYEDPYIFGPNTTCFCTGAMLEIKTWNNLVKDVNLEIIED